MKRATDICVRVVFELHFRGKDRANAIQDRISAFAVSRLPALLAEGLSELTTDSWLAVDRVELDAGEICITRMEDDLATAIVKSLRDWVFSLGPLHVAQISPSLSPAGARRSDSTDQNQGKPPQRGKKTIIPGAGGLNAAVAAALEKPADWSEFLAALRDNHALRCRLADEVSPRLLRRLVAALAPDLGTWIADCAETLFTLHERLPLLAVNIHVFRRSVWESILCELAVPQRSDSTQLSFTINVVTRLAARHGRGVSEIAADLALSLQRQAQRTPMIELLMAVVAALEMPKTTELQSNSLQPQPQSSSVVPVRQTVVTMADKHRRLQDLARFLELSVLPGGLMDRSAEEEMLELLGAIPDEVCALLRDLIESDPARKRLAIEFSEPANTRLLTALAPTAAYWMSSCMRQLRRLHARKPLFPLRNSQFTQGLWELCFDYVSQRKGQTFDYRSFLQYVLMRLAVRHKTSYETLLADVSLRRGPESREPGSDSNVPPPVSLGRALMGLLDETILGPRDSPTETTDFLVRLEYQRVYSDLDVLAYWLRWHKLPPWSHATNPEETGCHLGLLLRHLPRHIQCCAKAASQETTAASGDSRANGAAVELSAAEQIQQWLAFGLWPNAVSAPDNSQLAAWLENQKETDWLKALTSVSLSEGASARITHLLSASFFERIVHLLAHDSAETVLNYIRCVDSAGRHQPMATPLWSDQLRKYTLMYLFRTSSLSGTPSISIVDLARSVMLAMTLNSRVPYERLLDSVEQESHGHIEVETICRSLREELETDQSGLTAGNDPVMAADEHETGMSGDPAELVLHYVKFGCLPEQASTASFSDLKRIAARLSDEQISSLAQSCSNDLVGGRRSAQRVASLLSRKGFLRFASSLPANTSVMDEVEHALLVLASRFSVPSGPLVVAARVFLLRHPHRLTGTSPETSSKTVLSVLLPEISSLTDIKPELIRRELQLASAGEDIPDKNPPEQERRRHESENLLSSRSDKPRSLLFESQGHQSGATEFPVPRAHDEPGADQHDSFPIDDVSHERLAALSHFLRTGEVPWWGEVLSREPSRNWFAGSLADDPQLLVNTLRSICQSPGALQRLTRYAVKNDLEQIVRAAAPEYAGMLLLYICAGSGLSENTHPSLVGVWNSTASIVHWQETLGFVLDEQSRYSSATAALQQLTLRISRALAVDHRRYVASVAQIARQKRSEAAGYAVLAEMLEQLLPPTATDTGKTDAGEDVHPVTKTQERPDESGPLEDVIGSGNSNAALQQLDYLLRHGSLPEGASQKDRDELMAQIMEESSQRPGEYRHYLLNMAGREVERRRLVRFLRMRIFRRLWPLLSPSDHASISICVDTLGETVNVSSAGTHGESCREIIQEELLKSFVKSQGHRWDSTAYFRSAIARLSEHLSSRPAILVKRLRSTLEKKSDAVQKKLLPVVDRVELEMATMPPLPRTRKTQEVQTPKSNKMSRPMPKGEPFYVDNAGIVLLWPFLQLYFQKLSLLEKNGFRDEHGQSRAIYLLQHLATGTLEAPEHQLLLNKILIGVRPEQPLEHPTPLTEGEQALSEQLLKGVLQNWKKLKNSSISALRESFLRREGKLLLTDDGWSLTVSAKAYDVLLDSLPWSLSFVKLPWMKALLQVKWR